MTTFRQTLKLLDAGGSLAAYNGKPFTVVCEVTEPNESYDAEALPMYEIVFEDGFKTSVYPEEVEAPTEEGSDHGTQSFCPHSPTDSHEPDASTVSHSEYGTVDINCKHCGRSGSFKIESVNLHW